MTTSEPGSILAIDAAGHSCSVALWRDGAVAAAENRAMLHGQAAELLPMVERVMQAGNLDLRQVALLAAAVGPGGFTGLRIGLATARGLALAIGCPVIGISSFQSTAASIRAADQTLAAAAGDILVVLDSRRAEPFLARLGPDLTFRSPPKLLDQDEIAAACQAPGLALVCGEVLSGLTGLVPAGLQQAAGASDAVAVARLAADPAQSFALPADPHYLRPPDISQPKERPAAPSAGR